MPLAPAITDLEQLKDRPEVARLMAWNAQAVTGASFDRDELTVYIDRQFIYDSCTFLRDDPEFRMNFLCSLTGVDWTPNEPRFEIVLHLLSVVTKKRLRIKVRLAGDDAVMPSLTPIWPAANFYEREVFDLFGVKFEGHPYLRRIMMPDTWEGHPLRKDYPVEGYR